MERIVVGVDGSETSHAALRWAIEEAACHAGSVEAVHAWHQDTYMGGPYGLETGMVDPSIYRDPGERVLNAVVDAEKKTSRASPCRSAACSSTIHRRMPYSTQRRAPI